MAKPTYPRARRLAETIRRLAGEWLEFERADLQPGLVTVTNARVTPDLRHATVYFTVLAEEPQRSETTQQVLAAAPELRTYVARRVRLRYAPTMELVPDELPDRAGRIDSLLAALAADAAAASAGVASADAVAAEASAAGVPTPPAPTDHDAGTVP